MLASTTYTHQDFTASGGEKNNNMEAAETRKMRESTSSAEKELVATLPILDESIEEFYARAPRSSTMTDVQLKIVHSKVSKRPRPLILLFHSGGFFCELKEMLARLGREFALEFDAVVVLASCCTTPEHRFPTPMLDS